jgi:acyl-CoA synthetase (AMP-forming)/AMP-acid ligase II
MVPVQFQRLLERPELGEHDLSSIKSLMCCGSPLNAALKADIMRRLAPQLVELYGLTEGPITTLEPEDAAERLASVGKPLMGTDLLILDDADRPCPVGVAGEIVGRGRILMAGYNNRPDANAEATWTDAQGRRWLRTGDIGRLDEEGFLYLVDRKKDMIISGGQNIYPADIEAVLMQHPQVAEVAVIGIDSPRWGESPFAVVVPQGDLQSGDLVAWTNERVGKQQRIAGAICVDSLPRNPNGKVLKRELRNRYRNWLAGGMDA